MHTPKISVIGLASIDQAGQIQINYIRHTHVGLLVLIDTLRAGDRVRDCVLENLPGAIAVGLRAFEAEVSVNDLRVERR